MPEFVYLIRNRDLYAIGRTKSLELIKKRLAPGVLEAALETNDAKSILNIIQNQYSDRQNKRAEGLAQAKRGSRERTYTTPTNQMRSAQSDPVWHKVLTRNRLEPQGRTTTTVKPRNKNAYSARKE